MLRAIGERGGIGVYAHNITRELLDLDRDNEYVLFYCRPADLGRFAHHPHVAERLLPAPNKAAWDQVSVPLACRRERLDVVFHPKFTVPLLAPCPAVMVLHGAGWLMPEFERYWGGWDRRYVRAFMPLYCRRAAAVISVSRLTTDTFNRAFRLPPGKLTTLYFAPARHFQRVTDPACLSQVRARYGLPQRFILTLSGDDRGRRKNFAGLLRAFAAHYGRTDHHLVVGGRGCDRFRAAYDLPPDGYGAAIHFPGWIEQEDLPAVYSLADAFLYPSNVEAFPIPLTEALACGTPIITSNANGLREIVGDAAVLVDPGDPPQIAAALFQVLADPDLQRDLSARGRRRSAAFNWDTCARETLRLLTTAAARRGAAMTPGAAARAELDG
jgi:glycosyltransferase involved in cell wall biosynthesis